VKRRTPMPPPDPAKVIAMRERAAKRYEEKKRERALLARTPGTGPVGERAFARKGPPKNRHKANAWNRRRSPIKPVSAKRQKEQRARVEMIKAETGGAPVACERCDAAEANDAHEIVPRSAGGSITDRANIAFLCRPCHRWIGDNPAQAMADGWLARPATP
jgi:5-methylcytosine-specific restriction endonuclease McrA